MRVPAWRLILTGAAITILATAAFGLAVAANQPAASTAAGTTPVDPAAQGFGVPSDAEVVAAFADDERLGRPGAAWRGRWLLRAARHLVHAELTVTDRAGELVDLWLDHGTAQSIDGGTLVIAEAGGTTRSVKVGDATIVYVGRKDGDLADVTAGAEVFVQSRVVDGAAVAKRIVVIPARRE